MARYVRHHDATIAAQTAGGKGKDYRAEILILGDSPLLPKRSISIHRLCVQGSRPDVCVSLEIGPGPGHLLMLTLPGPLARELTTMLGEALAVHEVEKARELAARARRRERKRSQS